MKLRREDPSRLPAFGRSSPRRLLPMGKIPASPTARSRGPASRRNTPGEGVQRPSLSASRQAEIPTSPPCRSTGGRFQRRPLSPLTRPTLVGKPRGVACIPFRKAFREKVSCRPRSSAGWQRDSLVPTPSLSRPKRPRSTAWPAPIASTLSHSLPLLESIVEENAPGGQVEFHRSNRSPSRSGNPTSQTHRAKRNLSAHQGISILWGFGSTSR